MKSVFDQIAWLGGRRAVGLAAWLVFALLVCQPPCPAAASPAGAAPGLCLVDQARHTPASLAHPPGFSSGNAAQSIYAASSQAPPKILAPTNHTPRSRRTFIVFDTIDLVETGTVLPVPEQSTKPVRWSANSFSAIASKAGFVRLYQDL